MKIVVGGVAKAALKDCPFDPWRAPRNDTVRIIVADVTGQLGSRERVTAVDYAQMTPHILYGLAGETSPARRRRCGAWAGAVAGGDEHAVQRPGVRQRPLHPIPGTLDPCSLRGSL